jgi:hypothetical protein
MTHNPNIPPKPVPLKVLPNDIPSELKALGQWVCWRFVWDADADKWTKKPLRPKDGNATSHNPKDAKHWTGFEFALSRYLESQTESWRFDGVGLVLLPTNLLVGFDLDRCRDPRTGEIHPWALGIIQEAQTYWEISTSSTGLRGLAHGHKPGPRCRNDEIGFEIYTCSRFLVITGHRLPEAIPTVEPIQPAIDVIYHRIFPTPDHTNGTSPSSNGTYAEYPDELILDAARHEKHAAEFIALYDHGDRSQHLHADGTPDFSRSDAALMRRLTFYSKDDEQLDRLFRASALNRPKWESRADYRASTIALAIQSTPDHWSGPRTSPNGQPDDEYKSSEDGDDQEQRKPSKPTIQLSTNMTAVVSRMQATIRHHPNGPFLYQRAHQLSMIIQGTKPPKWLDRAPDAPLIHPADKAYIRELASFAAEWVKWDGRKKAEVKTLPPPWAIETLMPRPQWSFPPLEGIICAPTLCPDGSILDTPGYDQDTGLYLYLDQRTFPPIPEHPTIEDARLCVQLLREVFTDFPFLADHHKSAALAAVLSIVARFTIKGKVPFFAVRSTTRGAGKGLLIDSASVIATGRHAPRWAQTLDEEEERKRLITIAMSGDAVLHIDNITHPLGSGPLDMAMTAEAITERIMASHAERTAPIKAVFFGSGNNMIFQSDMARRVVPIDLAPTQERPDEREDFTHHPLLTWVLQERPRLVVAALTIIKAYIDAGRPKQPGIKAFGSYEQWSDLIRQSLIWAGQPDPCLGRGDIEAESDPKYEMQKVVLTAWYDRYGDAPKTLKEVKDDIDDHTTRELDDNDKWTGRWIIDPGWRDLQSALLALTKRGNDLDLRAIGYAFRSWQGRVLANLQLRKVGEGRLGAYEWQVKKL